MSRDGGKRVTPGGIGNPRRRLLVGCTFVAVVATVGSLYFSEVMRFHPCELCWYQRVLMYPLVVVLGVGALEDRAGVWKSALPLSVPGIGLAGYHTVIQAGSSSTDCVVGGGCGGVYWEGLGFLTIPRLSLLAFVLITAGLIGVVLSERRGVS